MQLLEFTLVDGERISIDTDQIYSICEIKKPGKGTKEVIGKTNIMLSSDDKGWILKESYDEVLDKIADMMAILNVAEAEDDSEDKE